MRVSLLVLWWAVAAAQGQPADSEPVEPGFVSLLSQPALQYWRQCGPGRFIVSNGVATGEGGMGLWWFTQRPFTNFILRGEFLQEQEIADSGVFLRFPDPGNDPWAAVHAGHEMEIGDPNPKDPTWRTGSIYPFAASVKANTKPIGQWNSYDITCVGHTYTVSINGETVTTWTDPKQRTAQGFIGLQNYNDQKTVRHRKLRIKDLP
jgi:3-keto-disaccharide hydrolase